MPANDHPNGDSYETQSERFGTGRSYVDMRETSAYRDEEIAPEVKAEVTYTFNETQIKQILADFVRRAYRVNAKSSDVIGSYREATHGSHFNSSPGYCKFTVKVNG